MSSGNGLSGRRSGSGRSERLPITRLKEIIVGEVVRITEGPLDVVECFNPAKTPTPYRNLHSVQTCKDAGSSSCVFGWPGLIGNRHRLNQGQLLDRSHHWNIPRPEKALTLQGLGQRFPGLSRLDAPTKQLLVTRSTLLTVPEGATIFGPSNSPENMLFLLGRHGASAAGIKAVGHEIVLYRIHAGRNCVLTTALPSGLRQLREGIETAVETPPCLRDVFDDLVSQSKPSPRFPYCHFLKRIHRPLHDDWLEVAFQRVGIAPARRSG
jgi:hypothetical protein